jgi:hypothetical protein
VFLHITLFYQCLSKTTKMSLWRSTGKRQKCRFGAERVNSDSNMTSFKRFESKPVVKIILIYDWLNLWRHRQFITIFDQFLHIRIEIIHGSHMYILFLPQVGLYVSFLHLANARGKTWWHKGLPVVKTIYTYGFHELFLKQSTSYFSSPAQPYQPCTSSITHSFITVCQYVNHSNVVA